MREIYENFSAVAIDYRLQLAYFESRFKSEPDRTIYRNRIVEANQYIDEKLTFIPGIEIDFDTVAQVP